MIDLLKLVEDKKITDNVASKILEKLVEKPFDVREYVKKADLMLISDENVLLIECKNAIKENQKAVQDYKSGNKIALNFLFGQVMKKSKGTSDPYKVKEILSRKLW